MLTVCLLQIKVAASELKLIEVSAFGLIKTSAFAGIGFGIGSNFTLLESLSGPGYHLSSASGSFRFSWSSAQAIRKG